MSPKPSNTMTAEDEDIVLLLLDRCPEGIKRLLAVHGPRVKGALQGSIHKKTGIVLEEYEIEEDVLLRGAFRAFESIQTFDERKGQLVGWFFRVCYNAAIDMLRERKGDSVPEEIAIQLTRTLSTEEPSPQQKKRLKVLEELIDALPELERKIVRADLAVGGRVCAVELAARFGSTKGSILASRSKALRRIREGFEKRGYSTKEGKT